MFVPYYARLCAVLLLQVVEKASAAILFVHFALDVVSTYLHLLF